jgi:hypothetical protein
MSDWESQAVNDFRGRRLTEPAIVSGYGALLEPDRSIERLRSFLAQGEGRLSRRAREHEFAALRDAEVEALERLYADSFEPDATASDRPP